MQAGDIPGAIRLYEQSAANSGGVLLEQLPKLPQTLWPAVGAVLEGARDFAAAARVLEAMGDTRSAAQLYDRGGDYERAAAWYQHHGDRIAAGVALERLGRWAEAIKLYEAAGAGESMIACWVRNGRYLDAAAFYRSQNNGRAEVDMLNRVPVAAPERLPAVKRLASLLEQFGYADQAVQLLMDTVNALPDARRDGELASVLLRLAEMLRHQDAVKLARAILGAPLAPPANSPFGAPRSPSGVFGNPVTASTASPAPVFPLSVAPPPPPVASENPFGGVMGGAGAMSADAYATLKTIPLFADLTRPDMEALFHISAQVTYPPNSVMLEQGSPGTGLWVLVQGSVTVARVENNGVTTPLAVLGPGNCVGEISLLDAGPTTARVVSQSTVLALFIARERFSEFLATRDGAALCIYRVFARTLAERMRLATQRA
jgi:tetratricopeptide (TPR) repeat protein